MSQATVDPPSAAPEQAFRFLPDIPPSGQATSGTTFKWCLPRPVAEHLVSVGAKDVHLLVVVTNGGEETGRFLFPINHGYFGRVVSFTKSNTNVVHATVVYAASQSPAKSLLQRNDDGQYTTVLVVTQPQPEIPRLNDRIDELWRNLDQLPDSTQEEKVERQRVRKEITLLETDRDTLEAQPRPMEFRRGFDYVNRIREEVVVEVTLQPEHFGKPN